MIEVNYTVQNPHMTQSAARGVVEGKEMTVTVDALEVELVAESLTNGGVKLRFIGDKIAGAREVFINDAKIVATFAVAGATAAEAQPGA